MRPSSGRPSAANRTVSLGQFSVFLRHFQSHSYPWHDRGPSVAWMLHFGVKGIGLWCNPTEFSDDGKHLSPALFALSLGDPVAIGVLTECPGDVASAPRTVRRYTMVYQKILFVFTTDHETTSRSGGLNPLEYPRDCSSPGKHRSRRYAAKALRFVPLRKFQWGRDCRLLGSD